MTSPLDHVPDLAAWLGQAGLDELELTGPGGRVLLRRGADGTVASAPLAEEPAEDAFDVVASTGVGRVLGRHPLREAPLVGPDEVVVAGQPLALLQVGALLLPIVAPRDGVVARMVAEDGALVGYGDPIAELWPEEA